MKWKMLTVLKLNVAAEGDCLMMQMIVIILTFPGPLKNSGSGIQLALFRISYPMVSDEKIPPSLLRPAAPTLKCMHRYLKV